MSLWLQDAQSARSTPAVHWLNHQLVAKTLSTSGPGGAGSLGEDYCPGRLFHLLQLDATDPSRTNLWLDLVDVPLLFRETLSTCRLFLSLAASVGDKADAAGGGGGAGDAYDELEPGLRYEEPAGEVKAESKEQALCVPVARAL